MPCPKDGPFKPVYTACLQENVNLTWRLKSFSDNPANPLSNISTTYLREMCLQFALSHLGLVDAFLEGEVGVADLFIHVVLCGVQQAVDHGA